MGWTVAEFSLVFTDFLCSVVILVARHQKEQFFGKSEFTRCWIRVGGASRVSTGKTMERRLFRGIVAENWSLLRVEEGFIWRERDYLNSKAAASYKQGCCKVGVRLQEVCCKVGVRLL